MSNFGSIRSELMDLIDEKSPSKVVVDGMESVNQERIYLYTLAKSKSEAVSFVNNAVRMSSHPERLCFAVYCYNFDKSDVVNFSDDVHVVTYYTDKFSDMSLYRFFGSVCDKHDYILKVDSDYPFFDNWDNIFIGYYESFCNKKMILALDAGRHPIKHFDVSIYEYIYAMKSFDDKVDVQSIDFDSCVSFFCYGTFVGMLPDFNMRYTGDCYMLNGIMFYNNNLSVVKCLIDERG